MGRATLQSTLGDGVFVPRAGFFSLDQSVFSASVWTDAVPIVLPKTERVLVYRNQLAKRVRPGATPSYAVLSWEEATRQFGFTRDIDPLERHYVTGKKDSFAIRKWQISLSPVEDLARVSLDDIGELDEPA
jgi:hypothetical protein